MGETPSATLAPLTRFPASAKVWHAITDKAEWHPKMVCA